MDEQAIFHFDIKETVYFKEGSQVSELRNIELTPDVSIGETGDYVAIKGVLHLHGTYCPITNDLHPVDVSVPEVEGKRYVEEVRQASTDEATFSHTFPIEVAVPEERITTIEDVSVGVETFNYEMATNDKLSISSTVHITGILTEEPTRDTVNDEIEEDYAQEHSEELAVFHSEAYHENREMAIPYREENSLIDEEIDRTDSGDSFTFNMSYESEKPAQFSTVEELYELEKEEERARAEAPNFQIQSQEETSETPDIEDSINVEAINMDAENDEEDVNAEIDSTTSLSERLVTAKGEDDFNEDIEELRKQVNIGDTLHSNLHDAEKHMNEEQRKDPEIADESLEESAEITEAIDNDVQDELVTTTDVRNANEAGQESEQKKLGIAQSPSRVEVETTDAEDEIAEQKEEEKPKKRTTTLENVLAKKSAKEKVKREQLTDEQDEVDGIEEFDEETDQVTIPYNDLAAMFSNQEEESYSSLRLYIVQERDTIETIAERYEIPASRILQSNRLLTEDLGEGQLIYIPYK